MNSFANYLSTAGSVPPPSVLITGCELAIPWENKLAHGDLWECGDVYFLNAVYYKGETMWKAYDSLSTYQLENSRLITLRSDVSYFERRGIILFPKAWGQFNTGALSYLNARPDLSHVQGR